MAEAEWEEFLSSNPQYLKSTNLNVFIHNIINNIKSYGPWRFYSSQQKPGDPSLHPQWITGLTDKSLVIWGTNLTSTVGEKFTLKQLALV